MEKDKNSVITAKIQKPSYKRVSVFGQGCTPSSPDRYIQSE